MVLELVASVKSEAAALVIPLSIMCTPLMQFNELPLLTYDPLICNQCCDVLNPYARVDYQSRIWVCPFCYWKNLFPRLYAGIGENKLPAELFPTHSTVEYQLSKKLSNPGSNLNLSNNWGNRFLSTSPSSNLNLIDNWDNGFPQIGKKVENPGSKLGLSSSWGDGLGRILIEQELGKWVITVSFVIPGCVILIVGFVFFVCFGFIRGWIREGLGRRFCLWWMLVPRKRGFGR